MLIFYKKALQSLPIKQNTIISPLLFSVENPTLSKTDTISIKAFLFVRFFIKPAQKQNTLNHILYSFIHTINSYFFYIKILKFNLDTK